MMTTTHLVLQKGVAIATPLCKNGRVTGANGAIGITLGIRDMPVDGLYAERLRGAHFPPLAPVQVVSQGYPETGECARRLGIAKDER